MAECLPFPSHARPVVYWFVEVELDAVPATHDGTTQIKREVSLPLAVSTFIC